MNQQGKIYFVGSASFPSDYWKIFMGWLLPYVSEYSGECLSITVKKGVLLNSLSAAIIFQRPDPPVTVYVFDLNVKEKLWHLHGCGEKKRSRRGRVQRFKAVLLGALFS